MSAAWLVVIVLIGSGVTATAGPVAAERWCPDVIFIGAPGSGQKDEGLGPEVRYMRDRLQDRLLAKNYTVASEIIDYPAATTLDLAFGHYDHFLQSMQTGVSNAMEHLKKTANECAGAGTKLVLAGYSQGAMVLHKAMNLIASAPNVPSHKLVLEQTEAILLLADGYAAGKEDRTKHFGTAGSKNTGIANYLPIDHQPGIILARRTASICNDRDIVCDYNWKFSFTHGRNVHTGYLQKKNVGPVNEAVKWAAGKFPKKAAPPTPVGDMGVTSVAVDYDDQTHELVATVNAYSSYGLMYNGSDSMASIFSVFMVCTSGGLFGLAGANSELMAGDKYSGTFKLRWTVFPDLGIYGDCVVNHVQIGTHLGPATQQQVDYGSQDATAPAPPFNVQFTIPAPLPA